MTSSTASTPAIRGTDAGRSTSCVRSSNEASSYWRDVGTVDSFYEAHMDLISSHPVFNLYNKAWPIHATEEDNLPPAKFVMGGIAQESIVASGSTDAAQLGDYTRALFAAAFKIETTAAEGVVA